MHCEDGCYLANSLARRKKLVCKTKYDVEQEWFCKFAYRTDISCKQAPTFSDFALLGIVYGFNLVLAV